MAITTTNTISTTICSSAISLSTITHHYHNHYYFQLLQHPPPTSSSSPSTLDQTLTLTSNGPPVLDLARAAAEAVALATEATQAAREALELAAVVDGECERDWRRKKCWRRKRRKVLQVLEGKEKRNGGGQEEEEERVVVSRSLNKSEFLSPREEAEFCMCLREGARVEAVRKRISVAQEHEPTSEQLAKAIGINKRNLDKILCNERKSRENISRSYRRLVVSIATDYQGKGLSLQDLIQEGSIGLLYGAVKFDPERGYKLSTYVYWWIKQAIIRAITNKSRTVRLPESMCEMVAKVAKTKDALSKRLQRLPTYDEIAEVLNVRISTVRLASERSRSPISLDQASTERGSMALQDIIPGPEETIPERMVKKKLLKQELEKLLKTLSKRELHVLALRFGLNGVTPHSFEEIGRLLKLSRERVRQINGIALMKLQQTSCIHDLKVYVV